MHRLALLFLVAIVPCSLCQAADPSSVRAEIKRRQAEIKERQEQMRREQAEFRRRMQQRRQATQRRSPDNRSQVGNRRTDTALAAHIARAPSPAKCLDAIIVGIKRAETMQQIIPLLASHRRENYERELANYDQQSALSRRNKLMQEGRLGKDLIIRMTSHPYDGELESYKEKAARYYGVRSFSIDGDKAKVIAYSHPEDFTLSNGKRPVALFGMVFESGYWRFSEYKFNMTVIRSP